MDTNNKASNDYMTTSEPLNLTTAIVASYVSNNELAASLLSDVIRSVHTTFMELAAGRDSSRLEPAIPVKKSVTDHYIVCLEDGKKLKMLKRHLNTSYNMSPKQYRERWNLPSDYPMVAPAYARKRSELAKGFGLGTRPRLSEKRAA